MVGLGAGGTLTDGKGGKHAALTRSPLGTSIAMLATSARPSCVGLPRLPRALVHCFMDSRRSCSVRMCGCIIFAHPRRFASGPLRPPGHVPPHVYIYHSPRPPRPMALDIYTRGDMMRRGVETGGGRAVVCAGSRM